MTRRDIILATARDLAADPVTLETAASAIAAECDIPADIVCDAAEAHRYGEDCFCCYVHMAPHGAHVYIWPDGSTDCVFVHACYVEAPSA